MVFIEKEKMNIGATIGKNYDNALDAIRNNDPNSEYYIPPVSDSMSIETMETNMAALGTQIQLWADRIMSLKFGLFSGDKIEAANITKIIDIQSKKIADYETKLLSLQSNSGEMPIEQAPTNTTDQQPAKTNWMMLAAIGAGLYFLLFNKR